MHSHCHDRLINLPLTIGLFLKVKCKFFSLIILPAPKFLCVIPSPAGPQPSSLGFLSPAHHHLFNFSRLLHWQAQQFVSCNLHEEGVENPNLFGVDIPDEGGLFPEPFSHLGGWGWEGETQEWMNTCFRQSNSVCGHQRGVHM